MYKTLVRERDGRMTDNEIIKYLEQAIDKYNKNEIFVDNIRLDKLSLDIIKRQQVEIERLKIENHAHRGAANSYKLHYNEARAEAVKEFAEKLKFVWFDNRYDSPDIDFDYFVDILVETLAGDTE